MGQGVRWMTEAKAPRKINMNGDKYMSQLWVARPSVLRRACRPARHQVFWLSFKAQFPARHGTPFGVPKGVPPRNSTNLFSRTQMNLLFFPFLWFSRSKLQKRLAGKTVLITGASYGIGECLAESLAETKAHLLLVAHTAEKLIEVKKKGLSDGRLKIRFPLRSDQCGRGPTLAWERGHQPPGGIDVLVNNAGKTRRRSIFEIRSIACMILPGP